MIANKLALMSSVHTLIAAAAPASGSSAAAAAAAAPQAAAAQPSPGSARRSSQPNSGPGLEPVMLAEFEGETG
jgi:hypothetical protein